MNFQKAWPEIESRSVKKRMRKEIQKRRPEFFEDTSFLFLQEMYDAKKNNYEVCELEEFLKTNKNVSK